MVMGRLGGQMSKRQFQRSNREGKGVGVSVFQRGFLAQRFSGYLRRVDISRIRSIMAFF